MDSLIERLKGWRRARNLGRTTEILAAVNALGAELAQSPDEALRERAQRLRARVVDGADVNDLVIGVFALVREVASRTIGLRPFDVQIIGGLALHEGRVAQMQTGEGKTLAAVAPVVLHALQGQGVHVLTFNDYLARRDAAWMGPIYRFVGLRVGCVQDGQHLGERRTAYAADVTYATAKEAGFDYLRDGLAVEPSAVVQRPLHMALVDEADSILIDEARIPLIIAGSTQEQRDAPERLAALVRQLVPGRHYHLDSQRRTVHLTDEGTDRVEGLLGCGNLYAPQNLRLLTELNVALHAATLMRVDVDYIVRHNRIEIVDEFTGRVVGDRHWPDGLQAAIEAKEGLQRTTKGRVLGQVTLQDFLLQYKHLCGMTATAEPAAEELRAVYGLQVQLVPPNRPCVRVDQADSVFTHREAKRRAVIEEVVRVHATDRPVLVGTLTVAESERLAAGLREAGLSCNVLNARQDEQEARVVAQAGRLGAVTIATNMAGRGTDIRLGGPDGAEEGQVTALGGLCVIGTNRHDSQRVDDQLRGRAGRQGDPGSSRIFVSLEDDLLQQETVRDLIPARYRPDPQWEPLDNPVVRRAIAHAQRVVDGRHFDARQALWSYSRLVEQQRRIVAEERRRILAAELRPDILRDRVPEAYERLCRALGDRAAANLERRLTLRAIDASWADHLAAVAEVRDGIHLVAVGGLSPLQEFNKAVARSYEQASGSVADRVIEAFTALPVTEEGIGPDADGLGEPLVTWTYLVHEDVTEDPLAATLISQHHIGFAAAAALAGPLLMLWAARQRLQRQKGDRTH